MLKHTQYYQATALLTNNTRPKAQSLLAKSFIG